jgi:hypothetical protein
LRNIPAKSEYTSDFALNRSTSCRPIEVPGGFAGDLLRRGNASALHHCEPDRGPAEAIRATPASQAQALK